MGLRGHAANTLKYNIKIYAFRLACFVLGWKTDHFLIILVTRHGIWGNSWETVS